jgi:hypothetical protein
MMEMCIYALTHAPMHAGSHAISFLLCSLLVISKTAYDVVQV